MTLSLKQWSNVLWITNESRGSLELLVERKTKKFALQNYTPLHAS